MLKKYFQQYQSSQDQNYQPTQKEHKQYQYQHKLNKKIKKSYNKSIHQYYLDMLQQISLANQKCMEKCEQSGSNHVELANNILNSESIKPNKRLIFAGKQYILNQQTGQLQAIQRKPTIENFQHSQHDLDHDSLQLRNRHISYQYLNHVMQAIYNRSKKINAIGKSKLDWKGFVKQQGIQDKLHYNRKGGVIQNMQFIRNTK